MRTKRLVALILAASIPVSVLAGCAGKKENTKDTTNSNESAAGTLVTKLPITKDPIKITYYTRMEPNVGAIVKSYADTEYFKELAKRTNVNVEFIHPAAGQELNQLNLLIASGQYPDIIENTGQSFPNGNENGIDDKVIIDLKEGVNKYMPNLKKIFDENAAVKKGVITSKGYYGAIPGLNIPSSEATTGGVFIRKDWLDELNIKAPESISDWYNVLKTLKEKKNIAYPLSVSWNDLKNSGSNIFRGAYGVTSAFYQDNGKIKYGPLEQGYKDWVTEMNKWYNEGLLDKEFMTLTPALIDARVTNNQTAAVYGGIGGTLGKYLPLIQQKDSKATMVATKQVALKNGEIAKIAPYNPLIASQINISSTNKYMPETLKWLDYMYSEEGNILKNFGVEGVTYKMENGYPKYTDLITKNPDGLPMVKALTKYTQANYAAPGKQDKRYLEQYYTTPEQIDALNNLKAHDTAKYTLMDVPLANFTTQEEQDFFTQNMSQIQTYMEEMTLKFIVGQEPLSNFDTKYKEQLKKMNIEKAISYRQIEFDKYNSNK